jgi:Flp pilus assembly protein TadG
MTTRKDSRKRRGQAIVEMTLVGIPLIFVLISIFEISRGMWMYHTLAYSVREGTRYASVHGVNCTKNGNTCTATVANVATAIKNAGVGLDLGTTQLTLTSSAGAVSCALTACLAITSTPWPPAGGNQVGQNIQIFMTTPFRSALAMLWPGKGRVSFTVATLGARSSDNIQF